MNEVIKRPVNLPVSIKDLTKFVLIGREKLIAVRAEMRAIDKMDMAVGVKEQKKEEAIWLAGALLDAESRLGELLKDLPSPAGRKAGKGGVEKVLPAGITHKQSHQFQAMAAHLDIVEQVKAEAEENDDLPTRAEVLRRIKGPPHVSHNSGENEWYTPKPYVEAARSVMGKIELDPASTPEANKVIKSERIYTQKDDGLKQEWTGKIWLNPPYASDLIGKFIDKLAVSVESKQVSEALVLVNNATETKWFARLASVSSFLCFPNTRIRFWKPDSDKAAPLQGQVVAYIGLHGKKFLNEFKNFGIIVEIVR